jgi:hypothetical protein
MKMELLRLERKRPACNERVARTQMKYVVFSGVVFLFLALCVSSCSIPNLEDPACTDARTEVRQFYSFHFGNDMRPSAENLQLREKFLTPELVKTLSASNETTVDYFTATSDYPKSFRIGECKVVSPVETEFQVVLLWRDDKRSEQKELAIKAIKTGDKWLIDKVLSK